MSTRKKMPFIAINCGAIPEALFESELFGYEKGSFTGAFGKKLGKIEEANGGTLFLDEVGELPMMMQTKLLRVLQERKVQRIGSTKEVAVDIRIIAATNADLESKVRKGEFREDLYYRLNVIPVHISPLRERTEDIIPLIEHFSENKITGGLNISEEAKQELEKYGWPGNVREVGNIVERLHVFFQHTLIERKQVMQVLSNKPITPLHEDEMEEDVSVSLSVRRTKVNLKESVTEFEKRLIEKALNEANGVVKIASVSLGVKRTTMLEKMKRMGIE
jgi:transcriptional regulator with PAS, ATPase and Fis domain